MSSFVANQVRSFYYLRSKRGHTNMLNMKSALVTHSFSANLCCEAVTIFHA